jgi:CxxC-x17-CxxC domain-containing protein
MGASDAEGGGLTFEDRALACSDCGVEFIWTAGEQDFYQKKGFSHPPKRCKTCRKGPPSRRSAGSGRVEHVEYAGSIAAGPRRALPPRAAPASVEANCSACGAMARLPFRPDGIRPVYCRACYQERRRSSSPRS